MNNFVTDAINLKSYNLSEADKIIVMYSKEKGLIRGVAKGVKSQRVSWVQEWICLLPISLCSTKGKILTEFVRRKL